MVVITPLVSPLSPPGLRLVEKLPLEAHPEKTRQAPEVKSPSLALLEKVSKLEQERFVKSKQVLTFHEYLEEVVNNPRKQLRLIPQYTVDCINYWNKIAGIDLDKKIKVLGHEVRPLAFVQKPWEPKELLDKSQVFGQELFFNELLNTLEVITRKKHPDRVIVVHGPNATGKSLAFETLFEALENYSKEDEGALYTYHWVFKDPSIDKAPIGFKPEASLNGEPIGVKDIGISIASDGNSHPVFLLNKEARVELLNELERLEKLPKDFNKDDIISGTMDSKSQKIYDALWKHYDGDVSKILNHVHVVRWTFSSQNRKGLVLIQPEDTPSAQLVPITPEIDWGKLPLRIKDAFSRGGLHQLEGEFIEANRGVIVYDDAFKDGKMADKLFLLRAAEKARTTISTGHYAQHGMKAVDELLSILIFAATNDETLNLIAREYQDWDSLKERFSFVPMGFERRYGSVAKIFEDKLTQMIPEASCRHISPHVLKTFGLWLTMTYLFPPSNMQYYESLDINPEVRSRLKEAIKKMEVLNKALLYQGEDINSHELDPRKQKFSPEEQEILSRHLDKITDEYNLGVGKHKFVFYEGSIGLSSRIAEKILERAIELKPSECFSVLEVFDTLEDWIKHGFEFEEKRARLVKLIREEVGRARNSSYEGRSNTLEIPEPPQFTKTIELLMQVKNHTKRKLRFEVQQALGFIKSKEEHLQTLKKYIEHASASCEKRQIKKEYRDPSHSDLPNERFMRHLEKILNPKDLSNPESDLNRVQFREEIVQAMGRWAIKNEGKNPQGNIEKIFPHYFDALISGDIQSNKERLLYFLSDLRVYLERGGDMKSHNISDLQPERMGLLKQGLEGLYKMGYCDKCIPKLIYFAFDEAEYKEAFAALKKS